MSSHSLIFAPFADDDVRYLLAYTAARWGEARAVAFKARLDAAADRLLAFPLMDRRLRIDDVEYRVLVVGEHMPVYRAFEDSVVVYRVAHQRTNPEALLRDP